MADGASRADGEFSALAPLSAACKVAKVSASTTAAELLLEPGVYKCFLEGAASADVCVLEFAAALGGAAAEVAATADNGTATYRDGAAFRGDEVERVVVGKNKPYVSYVLSASGTTANLWFVRLK